jgi:hypothetical protein
VGSPSALSGVQRRMKIKFEKVEKNGYIIHVIKLTNKTK